jgi:hypothetical protein
MVPPQKTMAQVFKLLTTQGPLQNAFNGDHFGILNNNTKEIGNGSKG